MVTASPVLAQTLDNGLHVLLRESHDAPIASFWVWYRVGSRNEVPGLTGISHWVEHMQFKGTPSLEKGAIFREVSRQGGTLNALTSHDWTAYFETLPVDRLDLSLRIESDRMVSSLFDPEETESERTVILSERQGAENAPTYLLTEELLGAAFRAHPYGHMVIGHEADLGSISRDDLYTHYRRYYLPNNAIIAAAGDFDAKEMLDRIEEGFGSIPAGDAPPPVRASEPRQLAERRVILRRPAPAAYLRMGFHAPAANHPDAVPMLVADAVLSGGKGMGLGGGGPMGRSARLYRALVATGLARSANSDFDLTLDPSLLTIGATALPGVDPERIEVAVDEQVRRLWDEPVSQEELARTMKQVRAQYVYSLAGVTNQAFWLGQMEIVDSHERVEGLLAEIERVTPEDIQRVATTYLKPEQRTVGWLLPDGPAAGGAPGVVDSAAVPMAPRLWSIHGAAASSGDGSSGKSAPFSRSELPGGIILLSQSRRDDPAVYTRFRIEAGTVAEPEGRDGLATFTARMLQRGQEGRTFEQLNELTDSLGATLSVESGRRFVDISLRCLREDLRALIGVIAHIVRRPTFPAEEIEKVRQQMITGIREADDNTRAMADLALRRLIFPATHPNARRVLGEAKTVESITRDELISFHAKSYGANALTIAMAGGFGDATEVATLIAAQFADWRSDVVVPPVSKPVPPPATTVRATREMPSKSQVDIAMGFPTLSRSHPDYYALETANLILGQLGLMGRLGASVRDRQGLAYYAYSSLDSGREQSLWNARAGVSPKDVERAIDGVRTELKRILQEPVSEGELHDARSYSTGVLPLALERSDGVVATLLAIEHFDLGLDYLERYPAIINALTREQLLAAAQTHLNPERLAIAAAGPEAVM
ncbi:MAG TPA: pitrilysin family protein [Thermomicrobiales bacterium]|nr:pitrilysin family protein [Thermomicrobiales bacterium]